MMQSPTVTASLQSEFVKLQAAIEQYILGQTDLVQRLIIALLADGHLLVEGAPGLAKTKAIKTLAGLIHGSFHRIQFTPDLLPADITGTDIYRPQDASFQFQQGPIFHNLILADEINRAPAKVQSALLEAMAERQVSIGNKTYPLPDLFLVMATQNPLEQEGTYPLPEAQLDRFLLYVKVDYPNKTTEQQILALARHEISQQPMELTPILAADMLASARSEIVSIYLSDKLEQYIVQLVMATRDPAVYDEKLAAWIRYGASPRGTIGLDRCARAHAWLHGRDYVSPADIHAVIHDVLRHRIILSFAAQADHITTDQCIDELLNQVAVP